MEHKECMESNTKEAMRVREILGKIETVKIPDDLIMYKILTENISE